MGSKLMISYNNSSICILDIETFKITQSFNHLSKKEEIQNPKSQINKIISHPKESLLFAGYEDRNIRYFDIRESKCIHSMVGHLEGVSSLTITPSGDYLISGGHDCSLRFWDINARNCIQETMANHKKFEESIQSIAVHPIKPLLASAGADSTVKL